MGLKYYVFSQLFSLCPSLERTFSSSFGDFLYRNLPSACHVHSIIGFVICLRVSPNISPYVCYCKRKICFAFRNQISEQKFQVITLQRKYYESISSKWTILKGSLSLTWNIKGLLHIIFAENYVYINFSSLTGFQSVFSYNFRVD